MKIPVFLSCPTKLNAGQDAVRSQILHALDGLGLEPRTLGASDYPTRLPLREVMVIARHCAGGVVLGFEQQFAPSVEKVRGFPASPQDASLKDVCYPTPWNHLEAGILFALDLPQLVFRDPGISGGIFDPGVSDVFVHPMPKLDATGGFDTSVRAVFLKWQAEVRLRYYEKP